MVDIDKLEDRIDWRLTTWDGARRESIRRWAALPLEDIVAALEEMQELSEALSQSNTADSAPRPAEADSAVHEKKKD